MASPEHSGGIPSSNSFDLSKIFALLEISHNETQVSLATRTRQAAAITGGIIGVGGLLHTPNASASPLPTPAVEATTPSHRIALPPVAPRPGRHFEKVILTPASGDNVIKEENSLGVTNEQQAVKLFDWAQHEPIIAQPNYIQADRAYTFVEEVPNQPIPTPRKGNHFKDVSIHPLSGEGVIPLERKLGVEDARTAVVLFDERNHEPTSYVPNYIQADRAYTFVEEVANQPIPTPRKGNHFKDVNLFPPKGGSVTGIEEKLGVRDRTTAVQLFNARNHEPLDAQPNYIQADRAYTFVEEVANHPKPSTKPTPIIETVPLAAGESEWTIAQQVGKLIDIPPLKEGSAIEQANTSVQAQHLPVGYKVKVPLLGKVKLEDKPVMDHETMARVANAYGLSLVELRSLQKPTTPPPTGVAPKTEEAAQITLPSVNLRRLLAKGRPNPPTNATTAQEAIPSGAEHNVFVNDEGTFVQTSYEAAPLFQAPKEDIALDTAAAAKYSSEDPALSAAELEAQQNAESHFDPTASSSADAYGIAQMLLGTIQQQAPGASPDIPSQEIPAEAKYMAYLYDYIKDNSDITDPAQLNALAIAAYNAGPGNVQKANWTIPPFEQTQNYVQEILYALPYYQNLTNAYRTSTATASSHLIGMPRMVGLSPVPGNPEAVAGPPNVVFYSQYGNWDFEGTSYNEYDACAPTTEAADISTLTGKKVTPEQLAVWNNEHGEHSPQGTEWESFTASAEHYGLGTEQLSNLDQAAAIIRQGGMVIIAGSGQDPFTPDGHVLSLRGLDANGNFLVMNPNSSPTDPGDPNDRYSAAQLEAAISTTDTNGMGIYAVFKKPSTTPDTTATHHTPENSFVAPIAPIVRLATTKPPSDSRILTKSISLLRDYAASGTAEQANLLKLGLPSHGPSASHEAYTKKN